MIHNSIFVRLVINGEWSGVSYRWWMLEGGALLSVKIFELVNGFTALD